MKKFNVFFTLKLSILFYFLFIQNISIANAQPGILNYNGVFSHKGQVTILGSSFGNKTNSLPVTWDDLEDGSTNTTATIGQWASVGYPQGLMVASSINQRHANSKYNAYADVPGNGNEYAAFRMAGGEASKWFIQYWVYVGSDFNFEDGNIKIMRLWNNATSNNLRVQAPFNNVDIVVEGADAGHGGYSTNCSSGGWLPVISGTNSVQEVLGHSCSGETLPGSVRWNSYKSDVKDGKWHLFQWEYGEGTAANGHLKWWFDGKLIFEHNDIKTGGNNKFPFIVGWYMSNATDGNGDLFFDDAYIDNTWARVEIGNSPNYNSCTHREIQIPTAWNDGSITFTVNQGSFADGEAAYLFVVDANGNVSNSFDITFGGSGGGGGDSTAPGNITNLVKSFNNGKINLSWINPEDEDFAGVKVCYNTGATENYPLVHTAASAGCFTVTGSPAGQSSYTFVPSVSASHWFSFFTYDTSGNYSQTVHAQVDVPVLITQPTSEAIYATTASTINLGGSSYGASNITWSNNRGSSGSVSGTTTWTASNITLQEGENVITVSAIDNNNDIKIDTITVTYYAPSWSAVVQTGDGVWSDSSVTYNVRLLIEGSRITHLGDKIVLGFQGRSSGAYSIRKVSIAERDASGVTGDVVNSTYKRVTFDGKTESTWGTDTVTVSAGTEKLSNGIPFELKAGKDYYVTFIIVSPSVYLDPPSTYRELYFSGTDHSEDIDWVGNGYSTTVDFHAFSKIYSANSAPKAPTGATITVLP